jgi:hypothetical protein
MCCYGGTNCAFMEMANATFIMGNRGTSVSIVGWTTSVRFPAGAGNFFFVSRPDLGPTQHPIHCVLAIISLGMKQPKRKVTTHLHTVRRLRIRGAIPPFPQ